MNWSRSKSALRPSHHPLPAPDRLPFGPPTVGLLVIGLLWIGLLSTGCGVQPAESETAVAETAVAETAGPDPLQYPRWETVGPGENQHYNQRVSLVQRGHEVYNKYCVGCHGEYGDGNGPASQRLLTRPRDFTSGIYKFRSTDAGSLPLEQDLDRTIQRGLARVSMPAFRLMPEGERLAVIEYIKSFYADWEEEKGRRRIVPVPHPPEDLMAPLRADRGRMVYLQMGCWKCHGVDGRGEGATQTEYIDAWGDAQAAFDFTRGALKGGNSPQDIYRTFHTGLRSIMPSFGGETLAAVSGDGFVGAEEYLSPQEVAELTPLLAEFPAEAATIFNDMSEGERLQLAERNSWDLVAYILSLRDRSTTAEAVLGTVAAVQNGADGPNEEHRIDG